jgi:hypothetical protein
VIRLRTLERAGLDAEACVLDRRPAGLHGTDEFPTPPRGVHCVRDRRALGEILERSRDRTVLIASTAPGGGDVARQLPPGVAARWWPTGLHPGLGARALAPWKRTGLLAPLDAGAEQGPNAKPCPSAGLNWSVIEGPAPRRRRLAPWDGDYLLVPMALAGAAGNLAMRAFATVAENHDSLDLVLLAPPQPELTREARRLGVATRVHFAGPSPRLAKYAWVQAASALLLGCAAPLSGGVALRALACGAPVIVLGDHAMDRVLRRWLTESACVLDAPGHGAAELCETLETILARGVPVEQALARGKAVAELHGVDAVAPRLAAALREGGERRHRAA